MTKAVTPDDWRERERDIETDGLCEVCGDIWDQCDHFFENWICGLMPDGSCSLAGTEDCDFECPRGGLA